MEQIRVRYQKTGRAKYISHLDLMRGMGRALTRAGIPAWYTQGFHPHVYMTFALPLALGYESLCEAMDLRLTEPMAEAEVKRRLGETLPEGLVITEVYSMEVERRHQPTEIQQATYHLVGTLSDPQLVEPFAKAFQPFCGSPTLMVEKKTKKGVKQIDLIPEFTLLEPPAAISADEARVSMRMNFSAGTHNINPTLLLDAFVTSHPDELAPVFSICREQLFCADGVVFR